jgi:hypothetical protein
MAAQSKEMSLPPWGGAIAGATGAVLANALVYPLDLYVPLNDALLWPRNHDHDIPSLNISLTTIPE